MLRFALAFFLPCVLSEHLLTLQGEDLSRGIPACRDSKLLSCEKALVNYDALLTSTHIDLPMGLKMSVSRNEEFEDSNLMAFTLDNDDEGAQGVFVYREENDKKYVAGSINWAKEARHFKLDMCSHSEDCYTWSEVDATTWLPEAHPIPAESALEVNHNYERMMDLGRIDTKTPVTFTVTIFTTSNFRASFPSAAAMQTFINLAITESNQGYVNSRVPITMKLNCIVNAPINDDTNSKVLLNNLLKAAGSQSNFNNFRRNGDVAVLLSDLVKDNCGVAFTDTLTSGQTFGVVGKSCATGYYSFAHEIAHMAGCLHNRENTPTNPYFENAFGYLMRPPAKSGFRTIMAYEADGYKTRINYYSNPDVKYQNVPTGSPKDNNVKALIERRFAMAAVGKENGKC